jgi:hypothetical protein
MDGAVSATVVVPYARFLECQDRRRRDAAGLPPPDQPPAIDAEITVAADEIVVVLNRKL